MLFAWPPEQQVIGSNCFNCWLGKYLSLLAFLNLKIRLYIQEIKQANTSADNVLKEFEHFLNIIASVSLSFSLSLVRK